MYLERSQHPAVQFIFFAGLNPVIEAALVWLAECDMPVAGRP